MSRGLQLVASSLMALSLATCARGVGLDGAARGHATIMNGTARPTLLGLSADQRRAVGAVLTGDGEDWYLTCTGTLVAPRVVLTGAHCFEDLDTGEFTPAEQILFVVGDDIDAPVATLEVVERRVHPLYDPWGDTATHDVALLILGAPAPRAEPLSFNCTALGNLGLKGQTVQNVGFGDLNSDEGDGGHKWWVEQEVTAVGRMDFTVSGHGEAGVCTGDSGGPSLWTLPDGIVRILGTLSWGDAECGYEDHFARVDSHCAFVQDAIDDVAEPVASPAAPADPSAGCDIEGVHFTAAELAKVFAFFATMTCASCDAVLDSRSCEDAINDPAACTVGDACTGCSDGDTRANGVSCAEIEGYAYLGAAAAQQLLDYARAH